MIRNFCDRCDKQQERLTALLVESRGNKTLSHEICDRCWNELIEFFKPLPKESPSR